MKKAYYVQRIKYHQTFWLCGPFKTEAEAKTHVTRMTKIDTRDCPEQFITARKLNSGKGFVRVAVVVLPEMPGSWLGNEPEKLTEKMLF